MLHINHNKLDIYLSCSDIYIPMGYLYMTYMSFKYVNRIKILKFKFKYISGTYPIAYL